MNTLKVFCFGFGQVAKHFAKKIISQNLTLELSVTSRQETHKVFFEGISFTSYKFENDKFDDIKKVIKEMSNDEIDKVYKQNDLASKK